MNRSGNRDGIIFPKFITTTRITYIELKGVRDMLLKKTIAWPLRKVKLIIINLECYLDLYLLKLYVINLVLCIFYFCILGLYISSFHKYLERKLISS